MDTHSVIKNCIVVYNVAIEIIQEVIMGDPGCSILKENGVCWDTVTAGVKICLACPIYPDECVFKQRSDKTPQQEVKPIEEYLGGELEMPSHKGLSARLW